MLKSVADEPDVFVEIAGMGKVVRNGPPLKWDGSYAELMQAAVFCFVPAGDTPTSRRLFDAMISGCLPVVISDHIGKHLPFSSVIPYYDFMFKVQEKTWIADPKAVLQRFRAISAEHIEQRRAIMANYAPCIDWLAGENVLSLIMQEALQGLQQRF